jgi:hypothetical protein
MEYLSKFIRVDLNITPTYIYVVFQVDMDGILLVSMLRGDIGHCSCWGWQNRGTIKSVKFIEPGLYTRRRHIKK